MLNKMEITIKVDINDADFDISINEISQKDLDQIMPLIEAIKKFKPYKVKAKGINWTHSHNYPYGECLREDLEEKSPQELYPDIDEEIFEIFEDDFLPSPEYGFHTIVSIEICPSVKKQKLL